MATLPAWAWTCTTCHARTLEPHLSPDDQDLCAACCEPCRSGATYAAQYQYVAEHRTALNPGDPEPGHGIPTREQMADAEHRQAHGAAPPPDVTDTIDGPLPDEELARQAAEYGYGLGAPSPNGSSAAGHYVPPHDLVAEDAVVGAMLLSRLAVTAAVDTGLTAADFYRPSLGHIYDACCRITGAGATPDPILVKADLEDRGLLDDVGGQSHLVGLQAAAPGTSNAGHYAARIVQLARLRRADRIAADIRKAVADHNDHLVQRLVDELADRPILHVPSSGAGSLVDWHTLFDRSLESDWLLEPLIAAGRGHALYAGQKAGKSLLISTVLVPAALGRKVLDRPAGEPLRTLYLDYEMTREDVADRVESMGLGPDHAEQLEPLAYHVLPALPALDTPQGGQTLLSWALEHEADLVVVDTLARAVAGAENEADTYRNYYRHTGQLLKAAGIATLRLDHSGKDTDKGQRGSSAKADDVDVVWRLTARERNQFTLDCTHGRMGWLPRKVELVRYTEPLKYVQVTLTWPAGTEAAAAVLEELDAPLDISRNQARALFKEAGKTASTEALAAALKYRRERHGQADGQAPGLFRDTDGQPDLSNPLTSTDSSTDSHGQPERSERTGVSPLRGDTLDGQAPDTAHEEEF